MDNGIARRVSALEKEIGGSSFEEQLNNYLERFTTMALVVRWRHARKNGIPPTAIFSDAPPAVSQYLAGQYEQLLDEGKEPPASDGAKGE